MKTSRRNERNAQATAERLAGGKPKQSKYELKRKRQLEGAEQ